MAREIRVILTDDIDGGEADQTVEFSLGNAAYSIDLNASNVARLEAALEPFIAKAERVRNPRGGKRGGSATTTRTGKGGTAAIRAWAKENGYQVSDRGRIHADIIAAFEAAN